MIRKVSPNENEQCVEEKKKFRGKKLKIVINGKEQVAIPVLWKRTVRPYNVVVLEVVVVVVVVTVVVVVVVLHTCRAATLSRRECMSHGISIAFRHDDDDGNCIVFRLCSEPPRGFGFNGPSRMYIYVPNRSGYPYHAYISRSKPVYLYCTYIKIVSQMGAAHK